MTMDKIKEVLELHRKWIYGEDGGERANLHGANLEGVILHGADLREADLGEADLCGADLRGANLCGAYLCEASLCGANLCGAYLCKADLRGANLHGANLCVTNLYGADLRGVDLCMANLYEADLCGAKNVPFIPMACPDSGAFVAWKTAREYIVKLIIPEDARRSSATGRKCRCDKAYVLAIETVDGKPTELNEIASDYDSTFIYKVGETVTEPKFCEDRFNECAAGIHFFINRQEAVDYN